MIAASRAATAGATDPDEMRRAALPQHGRAVPADGRALCLDLLRRERRKHAKRARRRRRVHAHLLRSLHCVRLRGSSPVGLQCAAPGCVPVLGLAVAQRVRWCVCERGETSVCVCARGGLRTVMVSHGTRSANGRTCALRRTQRATLTS